MCLKVTINEVESPAEITIEKSIEELRIFWLNERQEVVLRPEVILDGESIIGIKNNDGLNISQKDFEKIKKLTFITRSNNTDPVR